MKRKDVREALSVFEAVLMLPDDEHTRRLHELARDAYVKLGGDVWDECVESLRAVNACYLRELPNVGKQGFRPAVATRDAVRGMHLAERIVRASLRTSDHAYQVARAILMREGVMLEQPTFETPASIEKLAETIAAEPAPVPATLASPAPVSPEPLVPVTNKQRKGALRRMCQAGVPRTVVEAFDRACRAGQVSADELEAKVAKMISGSQAIARHLVPA